jgi:hypothetical protein
MAAHTHTHTHTHTHNDVKTNLPNFLTSHYNA